MKLEEVMSALAGASVSDTPDSLYKAWTTATGLVNYDLERPAKSLYPVPTPLRNELPRFVSGMGDTATHWKAITAINPGQVPIGLSEGNRGGVMDVTLVNRTATYVTWGLENYVTYQAQWASEAFDSAVGRAVQTLLESLMVGEEKMILGGNSSVALGTTPTPTNAAAITTGGALSDGTYYVGCVALTADGARLATVSTGIKQTITRVNAGPSSSVDVINGGTARPSAQSASVTLAAGTAVQRITSSVTAVQGAVAYAWYLGSSATHLYLQQITWINSVNFSTAYVTSTQDFVALTATDYSALGTYSFNGFLYQTGFDSTSGGYYSALATGANGVGTSLTSDGAAGVVEIETALGSFWDNYLMTPDTLWVSSQEAKAINAIVIGNDGAPLFRFNVDNGTQLANGNIGGSFTGSYLNKFTNGLLSIRIHPFMPKGTMLFTSKTLPYPHSDVPEVARMKLRRDYFQIQYPQITLKYEYGVYCDGVLQVYFPPGFGVITNIAPYVAP